MALVAVSGTALELIALLRFREVLETMLIWLRATPSSILTKMKESWQSRNF